MISRDELKYKNIFFANLVQNSKIKSLYVQWAIFNQRFYAKYLIALAILLSTLLILFDSLLFSNPSQYQNIRLLYIASLMPLIVLILWTADDKSHYSTSLIMIYVSLAFNIKYIYFLYMSTPQAYTIVLLGNFFVIITSTLFMYRFWKEQYFVTFTSIICLLNLSYFNSNLQQDAIRLIYFHILSFFVAHYYRNQFLDNLYKKFLYISTS